MNDKILNDEVRYRLLKLVESRPDLSQRGLAQEMGVSLGKLNYCLRSLIDIGLIKVGNFGRSKQKLGYVYLLTPKGMIDKTQVTVRFLAHKEAEYEALRKEIDEIREDIELKG